MFSEHALNRCGVETIFEHGNRWAQALGFLHPVKKRFVVKFMEVSKLMSFRLECYQASYDCS